MSKNKNKDIGQDTSELDSKKLSGQSNMDEKSKDQSQIIEKKPDASGSSGGSGTSKNNSHKTDSNQDFNPSPVHY